MTPRERTLAVILIAGIVLVGGAFAGYQFVYLPLQAKKDERAELDAENQKLDLDVQKMRQDARRLADAKRRSLPADISLARAEYNNALQRILIDAKVDISLNISPRASNNQGIPVVTGKQPAYTKLTYDVSFRKADLWQIHDVLTAYYKLNLLHQITAFNIKREEESGGAARRTPTRNDLTVTFTTEGIIMDGAENRQTLLTVPLAFAAVGGFAGHAALSETPEAARYINPLQFVPVLAAKAPAAGQPVRAAAGAVARPSAPRPESVQWRDYTWMVFRDIFHGPYPKPDVLAIDRISEVPAKVGEKIPPVTVKYTFDDVINKKVTLSAKSDSPLFPASAFKIDQERRTITLTPAAEEVGSANVTVTATDANGKKVDRSFKVAITLPTEATKADISQYILLTSVTPRSDGTASATVRDSANNYRYSVDLTPTGAQVGKIWFIGDKKRPDKGYKDTARLVFSDDWSATARKFQIVAVDYDGLIVAESPADKPKVEAKAIGKGPPAPPRKAASPSNALAAVIGFAAASAPQGPPQLYRWTAGKSLKTITPVPADEAKKIMQKFAESGPVGAAAVATTGDE